MSARGFSVIELLVAMLIVALLAMIAYPSYAAYVTRTRRSEGQVALLELLNQQERYFTLHNRYAAFSASGGSGDFKWWSGSAPATSAYEIHGEACPGRQIEECIALRAEPGTARVDGRFRDPDCGTLELTSEGERRPAPSQLRCWP